MEETAGCFTLFFLGMVSCDCFCSVALTNRAVGWSAVWDCGISSLYSIAFFPNNITGSNFRNHS